MSSSASHDIKRIVAMLNTIPHLHLADIPTPLNPAPRLAREMGVAQLFIKRDDLTGFAGGGTKVRKLEYDFADILEHKHDVVLTAGGVQSNLARIVAAAASVFNLKAKVVLGGPEFSSFDGNLLLDILFGAEIRFLPRDDENDHLTSAMMTWADELKQQGARPYVLPIGGSTALGSLGCINAVKEIADQLNTKEKIQILLPVGSCGTFAGIVLGARMFMPNSRIVGISVSRTSAAIRKRSLEIISECCALLNGAFDVQEHDLECYDQYCVEYGIPTVEGQSAVVQCARLEGLLLDPVYTGKTMAGMIDLFKQEKLDKNLPTVFLHTGGLPILFSFEPEFRKLASMRIMGGSL
jgi:D-cysteine desulfhydrase family pyridoxal phosphate-dependent enzyme